MHDPSPQDGQPIPHRRSFLLFHHGAWYAYYREGQKQVRRRVGATSEEAATAAAQLNARLTFGQSEAPACQPISVCDLPTRFISHHEGVLGSSLGTVNRYEAATQHLENYASRLQRPGPTT